MDSKKKVNNWTVSIITYPLAGGEIKLEAYSIGVGHFSATAYFIHATNARDEYRRLKDRIDISRLLTRMI